MRRVLFFRAIPRILRKSCWVLAASLYPPASLVVTVTGCAGSQCAMTCSVTNVCLTSGCFQDKKDHCEDYPVATGWNTSWELSSSIRCDQALEPNGTPFR